MTNSNEYIGAPGGNEREVISGGNLFIENVIRGFLEGVFDSRKVMEYRKKPEVLEAVLWGGSNIDEVNKLDEHAWVNADGKLVSLFNNINYVPIGMWVTKNIDGQFKVYSDEEFKKRHERVDGNIVSDI